MLKEVKDVSITKSSWTNSCLPLRLLNQVDRILNHASGLQFIELSILKFHFVIQSQK